MAASFPGAVKTFATRSNTQVIDASHVNDLQDEVSAIEDGFVNATAPLNSSHATVKGLHVTGNSTFGSTVVLGTNTIIFSTVLPASTGDVLSAHTISGSTVTVGWRAATVISAVPMVKVSFDADQQVASGAWTGLNWNTEEYDIGAMHSTATESSKLTCAGSSGVYLVGANISMSPGNICHLRIMLNDASVLGRASAADLASTNTPILSVCVPFRATAVSDFVTVQAMMLGSTGRVLVPSTLVAGNFWAHRVST